MLQEQIYQLKIAALIESGKMMVTPEQQLLQAEAIYQWLTKEQQETATKLAEQKQAALDAQNAAITKALIS